MTRRGPRRSPPAGRAPSSMPGRSACGSCGCCRSAKAAAISPPPMPYVPMRAMAAQAAVAKTEIDPGTQELRSALSMSFELQ